MLYYTILPVYNGLSRRFWRMRVPQVEHPVTVSEGSWLDNSNSYPSRNHNYQRETCVTRLQHCRSRYNPSEGFHTFSFTKFPLHGIGQPLVELGYIKGRKTFIYIYNFKLLVYAVWFNFEFNLVRFNFVVYTYILPFTFLFNDLVIVLSICFFFLGYKVCSQIVCWILI